MGQAIIIANRPPARNRGYPEPTLGCGRNSRPARQTDRELQMSAKHQTFLVLTAAAAAMALPATSASASPGSGITASGSFRVPFNDKALVNNDRIKFQTKGPSEVLNQDMTFAPGAYSGWHHHPGLLIFTVRSGSVTVWSTSCEQKTYGPGLPNGAVFVEHHDDPMQVTSSGGAAAHVTLVLEPGAPSRVEDQVPFCATSF